MSYDDPNKDPEGVPWTKDDYSDEYKEYFSSPEWEMFRWECIARAKYRCQGFKKTCGRLHTPDAPLEVHHFHYDNFQLQTFEEIAVYCHDCHREADKERRLHAGVRTFAWQKYGDHWAKIGWPRLVMEFKIWKGRHGGLAY